MTNKIKNAFIFIIHFVVSCINLLIASFCSIFRIKDSITDGSIWFAIFYQIFLILITISLFSTRIDALIYDYIYGQEDLASIIILSVILIAIILFINAFIEFIFRLRHKGDTFKALFSLQKSGHNYMMTIISLMALYAAIDSYHANEINTMLLTFGLLIFICIIITDLYNALFLSQNVVKDICNNLQSHYDNLKK